MRTEFIRFKEKNRYRFTFDQYYYYYAIYFFYYQYKLKKWIIYTKYL